MNNNTWLKELFSAIDRKDTTKFCSFLTEDCELTFGNNPTVAGNSAIFEVIDGFFKSINSLSHNVAEIKEIDDTVFSYGIVNYIRLDNKSVSANFCNVFKIQNGLIKEYRIFVDISQLYS
jgi:ketosteroid isomerase-like protein